MKVLVFVKATPNSEKGVVPDENFQQMLADMGKFNDALVKAGIMKEADGLKPSSAGKRIVLSNDKPATVIDGPFAETKELVAGYWVWHVKSMDEAVERATRCPPPMPGEEGVLEIRPTYSEAEFDELVTDEHRELRAQFRKQSGRSRKSKAKASKPKKPVARKKSRPARARSKK